MYIFVCCVFVYILVDVYFIARYHAINYLIYVFGALCSFMQYVHQWFNQALLPMVRTADHKNFIQFYFIFYPQFVGVTDLPTLPFCAEVSRILGPCSASPHWHKNFWFGNFFIIIYCKYRLLVLDLPNCIVNKHISVSITVNYNLYYASQKSSGFESNLLVLNQWSSDLGFTWRWQVCSFLHMAVNAY